MLLTIRVLAYILYFFIRESLSLRRIKNLPEDERINESYRKMIILAKGILKAASVKLYLSGEENLKQLKERSDKNGVMFVGNHRSFFDIAVAVSVIDFPMGFISKKEIEKIPVLRDWMKQFGCIFIDRKNLKQSLKVIIEAIGDIKKGRSIWIYPEGTRSKGEDEEMLEEFKEGSFRISEKSGCMIVPIAMLGTRDLLEKHFPKVQKGDVYMHIGRPFYASQVAEGKNVGEYTREEIISYIRLLKKKREGS